MPLFEYKGMNQAGRNIRGTVDAENVRAARTKLKKDGIFVVDLRDKGKAPKKGKSKKSGHSKGVKVEELSIMTRQLATLIKANIPLVDSLAAVSDQVENPVLKEAVADVKNSVNEGGSLNKALMKYPKLFDKIYISMCEAGEMSGTLDVILLRLAEFKEAQAELKAKVNSAMLYPIIMFIVTLGMLAFLFVFVVPKIIVIFESMDQALPWYTQAVISISGMLVNYWHVMLVGIFLASITFKHWKGTPAGREQWDRVVLKLPIVGELSRMIAVSRFTRTLSTLLTGGVPMLSSMDIVTNVVDNAILAHAIAEARDNISEGESIAGPLKKSNQFPPVVIHMIAIGEKTGELENMLSQVSSAYDFQVKNKIDGLTSILGPLMIVIMGCVVAGIVFSIMIPMFEMTNMVS